MSVTVVTRLKACSGKGMALLAAMSQPLEQIRSKPDCRSAELFISAETPEELLLLEEWSSVEAHQASFAELEGEGFEEVTGLLEGPPSPVRFSAPED